MIINFKFDYLKILNAFPFWLIISLAGCASSTLGPSARYANHSVANPLLTKAWNALSSKDYESSIKYTEECISLYAQEAKSYNTACANDYPPQNVNCALLNDVSVCLFIKMEAYIKTNKLEQAKENCQEINDNYQNSTVLDCWVWQPAKSCNEIINRTVFDQLYSELTAYRKRPEVIISSKTSDYNNCDAFKKIVQKGSPFLPYIIEKIQNGDFYLNQAMQEITGFDIHGITKSKRIVGEQRAAKLWVNWWKKNRNKFEE